MVSILKVILKLKTLIHKSIRGLLYHIVNFSFYERIGNFNLACVGNGSYNLVLDFSVSPLSVSLFKSFLNACLIRVNSFVTRLFLYELVGKLGELLFLYFVAAGFCLKALKADKKFMNSLGMCALNTLIIALPVIDFKAGYTLFETVGTGIGAGLAFTLSMLLINTGMKHIHRNPYIPEFFKGTPALLVYISLIALALSCISGQSLFV